MHLGGMQGTHRVSCLGAGRLGRRGLRSRAESTLALWPSISSYRAAVAVDPHSLCAIEGAGNYIELSREGPEVKLLSPSTLSFFFKTFPFFFFLKRNEDFFFF